MPAATLAAIDLPTPKGAPAKGIWSQATPIVDGERWENFLDGKAMWASMRFIDCNLPVLKDYANKSDAERSDFKYCFDAPTGKLKDYPLYSPHDTRRAIKVGHVVVIADIAVEGQGKLKPADLEDMLGSVDVSSLK